MALPYYRFVRKAKTTGRPWLRANLDHSLVVVRKSILAALIKEVAAQPSAEARARRTKLRELLEAGIPLDLLKQDACINHDYQIKWVQKRKKFRKSVGANDGSAVRNPADGGE